MSLLALAGGKRTPRLEGKVAGFEPGTDTLVLQVVSERGGAVDVELAVGRQLRTLTHASILRYARPSRRAR